MIHKTSHWLGKLELFRPPGGEWQYSRSQEGPGRGLMPLQTPQQTEDRNAEETAEGKPLTLTFSLSNCIDLVCFPIMYRLTKYLWRCSLQSFVQPSLLPNCPLLKATIKPMDLHMDNSFHVSRMKRNEFISHWSKCIMPRKKEVMCKEGGSQP